MSDKPKITEGPVSVSVDRVEAIEKQAKFIKRLTNPSPLIEYTEYEKLKAENERLKEQLSDCGALYEGARDTFKELVREREAAKVMREALHDIVRESSTWDLFAQCALKEADEILEGDKING